MEILYYVWLILINIKNKMSIFIKQTAMVRIKIWYTTNLIILFLFLLFLYIMDARRITMNFLLSPVNISGILSNKIKMRSIDPVPILLYAFFNTFIISSFIFLLMNKYYDDKSSFFVELILYTTYCDFYFYYII